MKKQRLFKRMLVLLLCAALVLPCLPTLPIQVSAAKLDNFNTGSDFSGVKMSVIGDSISTYYGISNSSTYNPLYLSTSEATFGTYYGNTSHGDYAEFSSVKADDTWWKQTVDTLGMDLLVNNAWSGSFTLIDQGQSNTTEYPAAGYKNRAVNLHKGSTKPDIICVYLGTNDIAYYADYSVGTKANVDTASERNALYTSVNNYKTPSTVIQAYYIMISRMLATYPDAEIYCLLPTICQTTMSSGRKNALLDFNDGVRYIVDYYAGTGKDIFLVDLPANSGLVDQEVVRNYYYCNNVHPSCAGMDYITSCVVSEILEHSKKGKQTAQTANVTYSLDQTYSATGLARKTVVGQPFELEIRPYSSAQDVELTVTMKDANGKAVSIPGGGVSGNSVVIPQVTGDITISAKSTNKPDSFYWEAVADDFAAIPGNGYTYNKTTLLSGTYTKSGNTATMSSVQYSLANPVVLEYDQPWVLEWQSGGNSYAGGIMLFNKETDSSTSGNMYIHITQSDVFFGYRDSVGYNNSGVAWTTIASKLGSSAGAEIRKEMLDFKIVNVPNGTNNKLWLYVNGVQIGTMDSSKKIGGSATDSNVSNINLSGKDFEFNYMGSASHTWNNCNISYIRIHESGTLDTVTSFDSYRWEPQNGKLVSVQDDTFTGNPASQVAGSISGTTFTSATFELNEDVVLLHDKEWVIEWASSVNSSGHFLMSTVLPYKSNSAHYIFRQSKSGFIGIGEWTDGIHNNYGLSLADYGIDGTVYHKYAMKNEPIFKNDEWVSNMVYLYVDDVKVGALNQYFPSGDPAGTTSDWVNGRDLVFGAIGNANFPVSGCNLEYLQITTDTTKSYVITFQDEDGTVLQSSKVAEGEMPVAPANPTKATDFVYNYTFAGWSPAITEATGNATYTATYTAEKIVYAAGTVEPYLERVTSQAALEEGVPYVVSDYNDAWLHYVLTAQPGTKIASSKTHIGLMLEDTPSIYAKDLWYIKDGYLVYGSADSDQYLLISLDASSQGTVVLGSYNAEQVAYVNLNSSDNFIVKSDEGYLNRHGGAASDFLATAYVSAGASYWHFDRLVSGQIATLSLASCVNKVTAGATAQLAPTVKVDGVAANTYAITWSTGNSDVAAISADGILTAYNCGTVTVTATLTAVNGHNLLVPVTQTYTVTVDHSYKATVVEPTCTTEGYTSYRCSVCGAVTQGDETAATGHDYSIVVTSPTCSKQGYTTYTCKSCGYYYVGDYVNTIAHSYTTKVTDPTCTTSGYTTYTCSSCGHTYEDQITNPTGHKYVEKVTAPTCTAGGYTTYTCSGCGNSYTGNTTAATGHNFVYGTCGTCGAADPNYVATYYLIGYINGADYGCEGDYQNMGAYKFVDGKLTVTFNQDSYVFLKTEGNAAWYMTQSYTTATSATFYNTNTGAGEKMYVPGNVEITFTLTENADDTVALSYEIMTQPVVTPTLTLKAPTLEFKDMITVNAMFTAENLDSVVEMGMITYSTKVDSWSVETAEHVIPGTTYDESTGRYIAASQGIHAKYLGDTVYLACYAKLTDGTYAYTKLAGYSPVQYATSKLKGNDVPLKQLVVAMLNYGAAAQTHFNHNVENLANATLTAEQIKLPEAYRSDMVSTVASPAQAKQGAFYNNKGFAKRYPSISFEGAFCINYFFTPNYAPVDGITLYYWNAADYEAVDVLSISNASGSFKLEGSGTGEYRGDIVGIAAKALGEGVYVAAVYSDGTNTWTSGVLGYSIGAYCSSQATKGGTIADLAMATAVYGYQAKQYFG